MRNKERRKIKNKSDIGSNSGTGRKKLLPKKLIVEFEFIYEEKKYRIGSGRIKISEEGGISCLIRDENGKWKNIRGVLTYIKLKYVVIKKDKK